MRRELSVVTKPPHPADPGSALDLVLRFSLPASRSTGPMTASGGKRTVVAARLLRRARREVEGPFGTQLVCHINLCAYYISRREE